MSDDLASVPDLDSPMPPPPRPVKSIPKFFEPGKIRDGASRTMIATSPWWTRRRVRAGLAGIVLGLGAWLGVSYAVARHLTARKFPPFPEETPVVAWGHYEGLRFPTRDGQEIGAWFAEGKADGPSVLMLHGNGGCRKSCRGRAEIFGKDGASVLLITMRAHGDSTGDFNDIGYSARHDIVAGIEFLERRRPGKPIVVFGMSMGSAAAVLAGEELGHRVSGYILECPYQDLRTAVRTRVRNELPPVLEDVAYAGLSVISPLVVPNLDQTSPVDAVRRIPGEIPILILAGGADLLARPEEARAILKSAGDRGRLVVFETAAHVRLPDDEPERYRETVLDFIRKIPPRISRR